MTQLLGRILISKTVISLTLALGLENLTQARLEKCEALAQVSSLPQKWQDQVSEGG